MTKQNLKYLNQLLPFQAKFPKNYLVPVYHSVSNDYLPHLKNVINYKNEKDFEKDLDYLSKKFQFVDWDFFKENYKKTFAKPIALLTFDDGLMEFKEIVLPILIRKGIYAINFINPAFVDSNKIMFRFKASIIVDEIKKEHFKIENSLLKYFNLNRFEKKEIILKILKINFENHQKLEEIAKLMNVNFEEYNKKNKIYMNSADLDDVQKKGFGIAAHSWDHPLFNELALNAQIENTQKSLDYMKENNSLDDAFAFPFTDFGLKIEFFEQVFLQNKTLQLSFGTAGLKTDSFSKNLQRVTFENGFSAEIELNFEKNYFLLKKIFNKNIIRRL